jgi:hypothetical protein
MLLYCPEVLQDTIWVSLDSYHFRRISQEALGLIVSGGGRRPDCFAWADTLYMDVLFVLERSK